MNSTSSRHGGYRLGRHMRLGRELARGSEGAIFEFVWLSESDKKRSNAARFVAKIYFEPSEEQALKLEAMIANPPQDPTRKTLQHISIAWPQALILDEQGAFVGFIMPYINQQESFPLHRVYNPQDRSKIKVYNKQNKQEVLCEFTWQYLLRIAYNLAEIVGELHSKGYVVGDLNDSNILVTAEALVTLVDCDSLQVPKPGSQYHPAYFRCTTGQPKYTPPDLHGEDFRTIDREPNDDNFGLAVLIFLLLMEGQHPFMGTWHGSGPPPMLVENMRESRFPYVGSGQLRPSQNALLLNRLPPDVQKLMLQCFAPQSFSEQRPTAQEWTVTLEKAESQLRQCQRSPLHVYSEHLKDTCPWCARMARGIPDPFPLAGIVGQAQTVRQLPSKQGDMVSSAGVQAQVTGQYPSLSIQNLQLPVTQDNVVLAASGQAQTTGQYPPPTSQPVPTSKGLSRRYFGLVCCVLLVLLMYAAEGIMVYYMRSYIPLLLQTAPIGVFIALVIYLIAPILVFLVALKNVKEWLNSSVP